MQTLIIIKLHTSTYIVRICARQRAYSKIIKMGGVARRSLAHAYPKIIEIGGVARRSLARVSVHIQALMKYEG